MAKKVFISYSHKDASLLPELIAHLRPLERSGLIEPWFDGYITPGDNIDAEVSEALERSEIVLLLISSDFMNSDYCYAVEMEQALARHDAGESRVIPVFLRHCLWKDAPFGRLSALPTDARPVMSSDWPDKDEAWKIIAEGVYEAAKELPRSTFRLSESRVVGSEAKEKVTSQSITAAPLLAPRKRSYSDKQRDDFRHTAFEQIAQRFEASLTALAEELSGTFRRIDANRFTGTIYLNGTKKAGITVWTGGEHFTSDAVGYFLDDHGSTNSLNGSLNVQVGEEGLGLRESFNPYMSETGKPMDPREAAEHLWGIFVEELS